MWIDILRGLETELYTTAVYIGGTQKWFDCVEMMYRVRRMDNTILCMIIYAITREDQLC